MNHVNFDWFRPLNCHRQTPEQVRSWCAEAGLDIETFRCSGGGNYRRGDANLRGRQRE
jgi:hypothetical protein